MKIIYLSERIGGGGYSDIFRSKENGHLYKIYVSNSHEKMSDEEPWRENLRVLHFNSEREAYEIVSNNPALTEFTPKYYGSVDSFHVLNDEGEDLTRLYLSKCCIELEFIPGEDVDYHLIKEQYPQIEEKLHAVGIMHTNDMACRISINPIRIVAIDFAIEDAYHIGEMKFLNR